MRPGGIVVENRAGVQTGSGSSTAALPQVSPRRRTFVGDATADHRHLRLDRAQAVGLARQQVGVEDDDLWVLARIDLESVIVFYYEV
jgi:hypothetical protein